MINRVEEFAYIAFKRPDYSGIVSGKFPGKLLEAIMGFVDTLILSGRKRVVNKSSIKNWFQNPENSVVQKPVTRRRLMYIAALWVAYYKVCIALMPVCKTFEFFV